MLDERGMQGLEWLWWSCTPGSCIPVGHATLASETFLVSELAIVERGWRNSLFTLEGERVPYSNRQKLRGWRGVGCRLVPSSRCASAATAYDQHAVLLVLMPRNRRVCAGCLEGSAPRLVLYVRGRLCTVDDGGQSRQFSTVTGQCPRVRVAYCPAMHKACASLDSGCSNK